MREESITSITSILAVPLFRDMEKEHWQRFVGKIKERQFEAGEKVVIQGAPGEEMFVILEGEFKVVLKDKATDFERELKRFKAGDFFGEIALLSGTARTATVQAVTAGRALVLHAQDVRDVIMEAPEVALSLCRGLAGRLEEAVRRDVAVPFVDLDVYPNLKDTCRVIPAKISLYFQAVVIDLSGEHAKVAMVDPYDTKGRTFVRDVLRKYTTEFVATSQADFERFAQKYLKFETLRSVSEDEIGDIYFVNSAGQEQRLGEQKTGEVLSLVFRKAIYFGASDLHFEPGDGASRVRMRIDGNMLLIADGIDPVVYGHVVSRLKVMSEMDITIKRLPQDGRFPLRVGDRRIEVRVSTTPCHGGEKAVLRILDKARQKLALQDLILSRPVCQLAQDIFNNPSGLILVTGPTGSGKTTTLYAGLSEIWKSTQTVNIVTIEDPVEYQLEYATQIQVNRAAHLDFVNILRTVMRQDPDVILVGEIRDSESAGIALEAATTGHLVLSSLHTDFALEALVRLRKLQVKSYLMASSLKCVISQRLVARVCQNCALDVGEAEPVARLKSMGILEPEWDGKLARGKGCEVCSGTGEFGRVGVYEVLLISPLLRELIEQEAPWAEMHARLTADCFISMQRYSRYLLTSRIVSPEQVIEIFPKYALTPGREI